MKTKTMSLDEVVNELAKMLKQQDGVTIEDLANQHLEDEYDYQGDGVFIVVSKKA